MSNNDTELANFSWVVSKVIEHYNFFGARQFTIVHLTVSNEKTTQKIYVKYDKLDELNFEDIDISFLVNAKNPQAHKLIIYDIKKQVGEIDRDKTVVLDKLGWYHDNDKVCYNAGDCIITTNDDNEYEVNPKLSKQYHLEIYSDWSEKQAVKSALDIMNIHPQYSIPLFISGTLGIMRTLIIEAGIKPACAIYVVGETQNRKTTLSAFCTRLYNRSELAVDSETEMARVSSSMPIIECFLELFKDCSFILDDLFRNPDTKMKKEAERVLRDILRNYADNSPRKNMRNKFQINSQLIITAEYIIDNISDIGRCFMIPVDEAVSSVNLTLEQKKPLALSTFYYFFIKYLCAHYDEIVEFIKQEFISFRNDSTTHKGQYERIYETGFLMMCVFKIICKYAIGVDVITVDTSDKILSELKQIISKAIAFHSHIISIKKANSNEFNLSRALFYLLSNKILKIGDRGSECFKKGGYLYIRTQILMRKIEDEYKLKISSKRISSYFSSNGISTGYNSFGNCRNVKKYNNKSYLVLNWDSLVDDAARSKDPIQKIL